MAMDGNLAPNDELPLAVIDSRPTWELVNWAELWRYRELLYRFALRDITVRYKHAAIGVAWVIFQPLMTMLIFSVLFALLKHEPTSGNVPYALSLFCGLIIWQLFANTVSQSCSSLVANQHLITKAYFPRIILPLATILCGLLDFAVAFVLLLLMMAGYGVAPGWGVLALPLFILLTVLTSLAAGLWLSALNALYRDVGYVLPFFLQAGFYLTPVIYETKALIPERWRMVYSLNPLVGILEGFRWSLLSGTSPPWPLIGVSFVGVGILLIAGLVNFHSMERVFADRI